MKNRMALFRDLQEVRYYRRQNSREEIHVGKGQAVEDRSITRGSSNKEAHSAPACSLAESGLQPLLKGHLQAATQVRRQQPNLDSLGRCKREREREGVHVQERVMG